ncbi:MAG: transposase [Thiocapsa sp.]|nr:MAG: transposase [Thiocapsa sp.]
MMFDTETLQTLLNLPDIAIDRVVLGEHRTLEIHVHSTLEGTHCHRCGKPIDHGYGLGQEIKLRHLPVFDYHTVLVLRPKRYQCHSCEGRPTTSQMLSWYSPRASVTKAFEQQMLLELINSTLEDVSLKHAVGVDALQGILDRRIEPEVDWNGIETLEVIGIDEIALKKGHRDFVVVISAYVNDRLRVIALLPARTKAVVEAFFEAFPSAYGARSRLSARTFTKASSGPRRPCSANASSSARTAFMSLACIARDSKPCASASSSGCVARSPKRPLMSSRTRIGSCGIVAPT